MADFNNLDDRLRERAESYGIRVTQRPMGPEKAGTFDGPSITMNSGYDPEQRCYYLVHAVGSIVAWAADPAGSQAVFDELRAARAKRREDPARLEKAIEAYRSFEEEASCYAVWLLADLGFAPVVPAYTNFARADVEALAEFHRHGVAPVWRDFFARWNDEVAAGRRRVVPYEAKPIPSFRPVLMRTQEIIQEEDGEP